jgi:alkanesulfonate monooxygenase SsuD/methylene tetrahydromethanopterin reductase-like flavin-dependent oxidoreductase (luciferase family)
MCCIATIFSSNFKFLDSMRLSVLDQSVAAQGRSQAEAITQTLALAQRCEALGYHRFWVSEHHSHPSIVGTAPEVLMAAIAARTQRIRIGSAGVMLPHYAPLKVAEQFRVLDALAPGRIDLGVGRAPGSDQRTSALLNPNHRASDDFPQAVLELQAWVQEGAALPTGAVVNGLPQGHAGYGVHAYFITDGQGAHAALDLYRSTFKPSALTPKPQATLCVWALAADTEEEAWTQFRSRERWKMDRNMGRIGALLSPEEAEREYAPRELLALQALRQGALVGTGAQVADKLRALGLSLGVDEIVVITWTHSAAAQTRSYELLAREFF